MRPFFRYTSALVLLLSLVACTAPVSVPPSPTAPGSIPTVTPAISAEHDFLENALCFYDQQRVAMNADHADDLVQAGINACYDLAVQLDTASARYAGALDLAYYNESSLTIPDLVFRLYPNTLYNYAGELAIDSIEIAGQTVRAEVQLADRSAVRVALPQPIVPGESIQIRLTFHGRVPENSTTYGIFNHNVAGDVITLANWFPILAARDDSGWLSEEIHPLGDAVTSETALYHVAVQLPTDWQVAATGKEIRRDALEDGQRIEFISGPVRDFMLAASPNFSVTEVESSAGLIRQWSLPGFEKQEADSLQIAVRSLELYAQQFGDYPFSELDIVSVPLNNASGVEYPGLILMRQTLYDPKADPDRMAMVLAHEIVHQWWYSLVGNDVQQAPWQDEALATYSSMLYFEKYNTPYLSGVLQYFEKAVQDYEGAGSDVELRIGDPLSAFSVQPDAYSLVVYEKGALFFWDLRREIGDEAFQTALHDYFEQNAYQLVEPSILLATFERQCGCDLTRFYRDWGVIQ